MAHCGLPLCTNSVHMLSTCSPSWSLERWYMLGEGGPWGQFAQEPVCLWSAMVCTRHSAQMEEIPSPSDSHRSRASCPGSAAHLSSLLPCTAATALCAELSECFSQIAQPKQWHGAETHTETPLRHTWRKKTIVKLKMTVIKQRENNSKHQHLLPTRPSHTSPHQHLWEEGKPRPQSTEQQSRRGWGTNEGTE